MPGSGENLGSPFHLKISKPAARLAPPRYPPVFAAAAYGRAASNCHRFLAPEVLFSRGPRLITPEGLRGSDDQLPTLPRQPAGLLRRLIVWYQ